MKIESPSFLNRKENPIIKNENGFSFQSNYISFYQNKKNGRWIKKKVKNSSLEAAEDYLISEGIPVAYIEKARDHGFWKKLLVSEKSPRVSLRQKIAFCRNMEQSMGVEMGIISSLSLCAEMAFSKKFSELCRKVIKDVEKGSSLTDALFKNSLFDSSICGMISSGENSGTLEKAFEQVRKYYERKALVRSKIIKVMAYPIIVLILTFVAVGILMVKTVPTFVELYKSSEFPMPLPTRIVIAVSDFLNNNLILLFPLIGILFLFISKIKFFVNELIFLQEFLLKVKPVNHLLKLLTQESFLHTFVNLIQSGVRIVPALKNCRNSVWLFPYKAALGRMIVGVASGKSLYQCIEKEEDLFGKILVRTLGFGEKTGKMDVVLDSLAKKMTDEVMDAIDSIQILLEPILLLFIGGIVFFVLLSLFLPVFQIPKLL